jgi:PPK2 family polyphosphate:nucleotide phosphotransferase
MSLKSRARSFSRPYRIDHPKRFRLDDIDPADIGGLASEDSRRAKEALASGVALLSELQEKLYAQDRWALLLIFQAMDAAGKDGTIKHVMSGVNPQGTEVYSFKGPSATELDHDYLWRCAIRIPERGRIGIFNRSYYEEVLVTRVHPEILERQKLPAGLVDKRIWEGRFEDINAYERYLTRNGIAVRKFFLHVSKGEQKRRFLSRLEEQQKNWKFSLSDMKERQYWKAYQRAYEDVIRYTSTEWAPWYVVPADNKWFTRLVVAAAVVDALDGLDLAFPKIDAAMRKELRAAPAMLEGDGERDPRRG